jgi:16S rRNA (cytidine1402-2'-O)-methyltransferase
VSAGGGVLVLVATPIGNLGDLSPRAIETLRDATLIAAEDTRRTRTLLSHAGIAAGGRLLAVHAHNERDAARRVVACVEGGGVVAYVSDAGTPGVSDPGTALVRACVDAGLTVSAVPGPSALLAALVVSGFPTERFVFEGFLPRKGRAREERLETIAAETRTVVCFESPNRVAATLGDLARVCGAEREVAVARELTKLHEETWRGRLGDAVERAAGATARGEHVLVVAPAPAHVHEVDDEELDRSLRAALDDGSSARDAAAAVAAELGVPKRRAYDAAIALRRRDGRDARHS